MHSRIVSFLGRGLCLLPLLLTLGCDDLDLLLDYANGIAEYEKPNLVPVPGGVVNAAGGYLILNRMDMSMDTIFGRQEIGATYNAISGDWLWNFQVRYDGSNYIDETGAEYDVAAIGDGDAIPGTRWRRADANTIQTQGGLAYSFDAEGRLDHLAWATQAYPRIQYVWSESHVEVKQCVVSVGCTGMYSISLNQKGDPSVLTNSRTAERAEFDYDEQGRLVAVRDAVAVEEGQPGLRYEYKESGSLLSAAINSEGERIEYAYAAGRRIWKVTQIGEEDPTQTFEYSWRTSDLLYRITYTNPLGGKTRYLFDAQRRLHEMLLEGTGERTLYTWQGLRPSSRIEPSGATTFYTYLNDQLIERTEPSGNVVTYTCEPFGLNFEDPSACAKQRVEDRVGLVEERFYDGLGRVEAIANGEGEIRSFTYLAGSAIASTTDALGVVRNFPIYGVHGHWTELEGPFSDTRLFDAVGNVLVKSKVLEVGGLLARGWDANRQLTSIQMGATDRLHEVDFQGSIGIERRSDGRITRIARPGGGDHEFSYDAIGRLVEQRELVDGVWQAVSGEYDAAGNLSARELSNGMRIELSYDAYGRLTRRRALRDGVVEGVASYTWTDGRVVSYTDTIRGTTELYSYDSAGRLVATVYGYGEVLTREYDLRSRLSGEIYVLPGWEVVADLGYTYDLADRRVGITDRLTSDLLVSRTYVNGKLARTDLANGLSRERSYDAVTGNLDRFTTTDDSAQEIELTTIEFTAEGGPPRQQIRTETTTPLGRTLEVYWLGLGDGGMQNPNAVVGKRVFHWSGRGAASETFVYDELGNRVRDSANSFTYNAERNRLLSASLASTGQTHTYIYDEAGFVTSRNGVAITWTATERVASHGADTFTWDLQDRLVSMTVGGVSVERGWFGGLVGGDPIAETLGSLDLGVVTLELGSGARLYRHPDFRQNVSFTSDDAGQVVTHFQYAPYGLDSVIGSDADAVSFVGRTEIGELMVVGARIYDPAVGRFLSQDPVFQYANQYVYTMGNPVWFIDREGRNSTAMSPGMSAPMQVGGVGPLSLKLATNPGIRVPAAAAAGGIIFTVQDLEMGGDIAVSLNSCGLGAGQALPIVTLWWYIRNRRRRKRDGELECKRLTPTMV